MEPPLPQDGPMRQKGKYRFKRGAHTSLSKMMSKTAVLAANGCTLKNGGTLHICALRTIMHIHGKISPLISDRMIGIFKFKGILGIPGKFLMPAKCMCAMNNK